MSLWEQHQIEDKITQILRDVPDCAEGHQLGRAYLTAYQLAIEFAIRYPETTAVIDLPVGGKATGQRNSLAQYLAGQLSRRIGSGQLGNIEGGFLSNQHLHDISFRDINNPDNKEGIHSSLTGTNFTLSMFRLRE